MPGSFHPAADDFVWVPTIVQRDGEVSAYGAAAEGIRCIRVPGIADFSWIEGSETVGVREYAGVAPDAVLDVFNSVVTPLLLSEQRYEVLHASAVELTLGVVGFCGFSGGGKSTISHGLALRQKTALWADDMLALRIEPDEVTATALPFSSSLRSASREFFHRYTGEGSARPTVVPAWSTSRLQALFVLDPTEPSAETRESLEIATLSAPEALTSVLPHAARLMPLEPQRERDILMNYVELIARVPVYKARYTQTFGILPALIDRIEEMMNLET